MKSVLIVIKYNIYLLCVYYMEGKYDIAQDASQGFDILGTEPGITLAHVLGICFINF